MPRFIVVLLALVVSALAQGGVRNGVCPDPKPVTGFNTTSFSGLWFDQAHTKRGSGLQVTCDQVKFTSQSATKMSFASLSFSGATKNKIAAFGDAELTQPDQCGKMRGNIPALGLSGEFRVLSTDYTTVAVLWGCGNTTSGHIERSLILTRDKHPNASVVQKARKVLENNNISQSDLNSSEQHKCPEYTFSPGDGNVGLGGSTSMGWLLTTK